MSSCLHETPSGAHLSTSFCCPFFYTLQPSPSSKRRGCRMDVLLLARVLAGLTWPIALDFISKVVAATSWPIAVVILALLFHREVRRILAQISRLKAGGVEAEFRAEVESMDPLSPLPMTAAPVSCEATPEEVLEPAAVDADASTATHPDSSSAKESRFETETQTPDRTQVKAEQASAFDPESPLLTFAKTFNHWRTAYATARAKQIRSLMDVGGPATVLRMKEARDMAVTNPSAAVMMAWTACEASLSEILGRKGMFGGSISHWLQQAFLNGSLPEPIYDRYKELRKLRNTVAHSQEFSGTKSDVLQYIGRVEDLIISIGTMDRIAKLSNSD